MFQIPFALSQLRADAQCFTGLLNRCSVSFALVQGDDLRKDNPLFSLANRQKIAALMQELTPLRAAHNATNAQVIIAWTLQQPGITFSLCGARNPSQANENAHAGHINLSPDDIATINMAAAKHLTDLDR